MFKLKIFNKMVSISAMAFICLLQVSYRDASAASTDQRALMSYCPSSQEATALVMKNGEFFLEHHIDAVDVNCKILIVAPKNNKSEVSKNQPKAIGNELVASRNAN